MNNPSEFDALRRRQAEDALLLHAAAEIVRQDQEEFFAAQALPAPPAELMARVDADVYRAIRKGSRKRRTRTALARLGQAAAVLVLISGAALTLGYVSVDATREKINAFLLENFGTHVVVHTQETEEGTGNAFPVGWNGPVYPAWIPSRFTAVEASSADRSYFLYYTSSDSAELLIISIWPSTVIPFGDSEYMDSIESIAIQDVTADLCYKSDTQSYLLRFTKANLTIQLVGTVTREEIIRIAENISF